jgi:hypothetical protein
MAEKLKKYFKSPEKRDAIAQVSINCVIFGFHEKTLKVIVNEISLGSKPFVVMLYDLPKDSQRINVN